MLLTDFIDALKKRADRRQKLVLELNFGDGVTIEMYDLKCVGPSAMRFTNKLGLISYVLMDENGEWYFGTPLREIPNYTNATYSQFSFSVYPDTRSTN
jgi:hypothetical protein